MRLLRQVLSCRRNTAGPVYRDGKSGEKALLRSCYINSLTIAVDNGCDSVAFPLISSGIYGYPKADALRIATEAIKDFLEANNINVTLVVFDKAAFAVSEELLGEVKGYIDENYIEEHPYNRRKLLEVERIAFDEAKAESLEMPLLSEAKLAPSMAKPSLNDLAGNLDEPFSTTLLRLIDSTGKTDAEIYKKANIDRRLFSKIRSNPDYSPSKATVLAFAVALCLTLDQTEDLLERAGFTLSHSCKFDVIVGYFISSEKYDIYDINNVLFEYDQPLLGGN